MNLRRNQQEQLGTLNKLMLWIIIFPVQGLHELLVIKRSRDRPQSPLRPQQRGRLQRLSALSILARFGPVELTLFMLNILLKKQYGLQRIRIFKSVNIVALEASQSIHLETEDTTHYPELQYSIIPNELILLQRKQQPESLTDQMKSQMRISITN